MNFLFHNNALGDIYTYVVRKDEIFTVTASGFTYAAFQLEYSHYKHSKKFWNENITRKI
jgi:hypothetical protein